MLAQQQELWAFCGFQKVSLDSLCGLHMYVNQWESTDLAFLSGSPKCVWCNFGQLPIRKLFLSFSIL